MYIYICDVYMLYMKTINNHYVYVMVLWVNFVLPKFILKRKRLLE